jgi:hypothetical protein
MTRNCVGAFILEELVTSNPIPVQLTFVSILPAGVQYLGDVSITREQHP